MILRKLQRAVERLDQWWRPPIDPLTVTHAQAWRWSQHRRDIMGRLVDRVSAFVPQDGLFVDVGANMDSLACS